ncbi:MAG: PA14 domain-containing protein [Bacteroidota bacterium]
MNINLISSFTTAMVSEGITGVISLAKKQRNEKFAFEFSGYIKINKDGFYTFYTVSDDGSKLYIEDTEVVDNDGNHGAEEKSGKAALKKGWHKIKVTYYDSGGGNDLKVLTATGSGKKRRTSSLYFISLIIKYNIIHA